MKERPILFSAPMVRALLESRKTQTRRIVKPQPDDCMVCVMGLFRHPKKLGKFAGEVERAPCPYGKPGDRLWVREAWRIGAWDEGLQAVAIDYLADGFCRDEWLQVPDIEKEPPPKSLFKRRTTFERLQDQSLSEFPADLQIREYPHANT